jgi:outer membrane cobalamin receptor
MKTIVLIFLICLSTLSYSQKHTLSGRVTEASSGEEMIGASVSIDGQSIGVVTNDYGFYSLTLPSGVYKFKCVYIGYKTQIRTVDLTSSKTVNWELHDGVKIFKETVVSGKKNAAKVENKKISVVKMDIKTIKQIPAVFGEVDVLKTITFLPGIQSLGEGNGGISVRGGGQDQNLILLDEAAVYNASHLLGFFSVFNGDAIKDLEVYKGGIPAKYGGRLSSLIDIRMKDGNKKKYTAMGGIGTISSRLTLEGPLIKDKSSFMIAGRRSYADIFLPLSSEEAAQNSSLYFYDLNLKGNYKIDEDNQLFLSGYFGRDFFGFDELFGLEWGNATATLRWNHLYNKKLFSNISLIYSTFDYGVKIKFAENANFGSEIGFKDLNIKADYTWYESPKNRFGFGGQVIHHNFQPGKFSALNDATKDLIGDGAIELETRRALESALYAEHEYKLDTRFNIRYGLRLSIFNNIGEATEYKYDRDDFGKPIPTDTLTYQKNEFYNTYMGLEPRIAASYNLNSSTAIKASYNRTFQYIQQASNSATTLPVDNWFPSNPNIKPQRADQIALGWFKNFDKYGLETSIEIYQKWMNNQIDYRDGASLFFNNQLDGELLIGEAQSAGAEFYIKKDLGKTTGFLSYTLAKTTRKINLINGGKAYPDNNDQRHNLSIIVTHNFNPRMVLSGTFVVSTGTPFTVPVGSYVWDGSNTPRYAERNNDRIPVYHRSDIGFTLYAKEKPNKRLKSSWNFSVYNFYGRENPYIINFETVTIEDPETGEQIETSQKQAVQIALFKYIPSVTWNFEF